MVIQWNLYIAAWIVEHRGVDRKRARPTMLNVWRFGNPLKYSGLRAAKVCIAQQGVFCTHIAESYTARARIPAPSIGGRNSLRPLG